MLADVNLINPVNGNPNLEKSRIKSRQTGRKRVVPKRQNPDAQNKEESNPKESGRLEVYA